MQKWEYLFLTAEKAEGVWFPRFVNGEELEGWLEGPSLYEFSDQLGDKGWELVNITWQAKEQLKHHRLVFKRPIEE